MAKRVFRQNTAILVTEPGQDTQVFIPGQTRPYVISGVFGFKDRILNYNKVLGTYDEIEREDGMGFNNDAEVLTYFTEIINFKSGDSSGTTSRDDRIFDSATSRDAYFEGTEFGETNPRYFSLQRNHLIALAVGEEVQFQTWEGLNNPTTYDISNWQSTSFFGTTLRSDPGSVDIGRIRLDSLNHALGAINLVNNRRAISIHQLYDDEGSRLPFSYMFGAPEDVTYQGDSSIIQPTAGSSYTITLAASPALTFWQAIKVIPAETGAFSYEIRANNAGGQLVTVQKGFTFTQSQVDNQEQVSLPMSGGNNIFGEANEVYYITLQGAKLRGFINADGDFQNFLVATIHTVTQKDLATQEYVDNHSGVGVQADWAETDNADPSFIQNKPAIPSPRTDEDIQDLIGAMITGNTETGIDVTYDDGAGKLNFAVTSTGTGQELTTDDAAFLDEVTRTGERFDLSSNVFSAPTNVFIQNYIATGTPYSVNFIANANDQVGAIHSQVLTNITASNIRFTNLVGGRLRLNIAYTENVQGFSTDLVDISFNFGGHVFTFPLDNIQLGADGNMVDITIPNSDYTSALNVAPTITVRYVFRSVFSVNLTVTSLQNSLTGTLYEPVKNIAESEAAKVKQEINSELQTIRGDISDNEATFDVIMPRLSPYRNEAINTPNSDVYFLGVTLGSPVPQLSSMVRANPDNPRFQLDNEAVFVAVVGGGNYNFKNITADTIVSFADGGTLFASTTAPNGMVYFLYRFNTSAAAIGNEVEVETVSTETVVAWQDDIDKLEAEVQRLRAQANHPVLNLPADLVNVLENEVSVTEETNASESPTDYNRQLAGASNTTQTVFREATPNAGSNGTKTSNPINATVGDRENNKLVYTPSSVAISDGDFLIANDGTTDRPIIRYNNGVFNAVQFVPAVAASTTDVTVYPAPATSVSGKGVWQTVPTLKIENKIPVELDADLFFTRNIPAVDVPVTIQYRGHANNLIVGAGSVTLPANQTEVDFTITVGSETATASVRRELGNLAVRVHTRVFTGLPTINDVQVILSYDETRTIPATPATTREIQIDNGESANHVFAIREDGAGNLIIVGSQHEVNTGYAYTTLFGAARGGVLNVIGEVSEFFDYEDFTPINTTIVGLENHSSLPQFGLFTTEYTHETIVDVDVAIRAPFIAMSFTTTERDALTARNGMMIYNSTTNQFNFFENGAWVTK